MDEQTECMAQVLFPFLRDNTVSAVQQSLLLSKMKISSMLD